MYGSKPRCRSARVCEQRRRGRSRRRAEHEAERRLLRGEEGRVPEQLDQRAAPFRRERLEELSTMSWMCGIVGPSTRNGHVQPDGLADPAVGLPQRPEDRDPTTTSPTRFAPRTAPILGAVVRSTATAAIGGMLTTLRCSGLASRRAARSAPHRRRAAGAPRADRRRERRPARRLDGHLGARAGLAAREARRRSRSRRRSTRPATSGATLRGGSERALLIGGHIDSVPNGGWLDGCLNVMAGVEVLRRIAEDGEPAAHGAARQLGRRGGRALRPLALRLARGGRLDGRPGRAAAAATTGDGVALPDALAEHGVDLDRALEARVAARERRRLPRAAHRAGAGARVARTCRSGVVLGTFGVERHQVTLTRPGRARGLDADGQAARRARRRGEARARDPRDRRADGRRGGLHDGRRRHAARDRHLGRRDRRAAARPAPPRRRRSSRRC